MRKSIAILDVSAKKNLISTISSTLSISLNLPFLSKVKRFTFGLLGARH
jgi:hypothetical protein